MEHFDAGIEEEDLEEEDREDRNLVEVDSRVCNKSRDYCTTMRITLMTMIAGERKVEQEEAAEWQRWDGNLAMKMTTWMKMRRRRRRMNPDNENENGTKMEDDWGCLSMIMMWTIEVVVVMVVVVLTKMMMMMTEQSIGHGCI